MRRTGSEDMEVAQLGNADRLEQEVLHVHPVVKVIHRVAGGVAQGRGEREDRVGLIRLLHLSAGGIS